MGVLQLGCVGRIQVRDRHSLLDQPGPDQAWLVAVRAAVCLDHAHQSLEVLHVLRGSHIVTLVIGRDAMLRVLERVRALLVFVEPAAVSSDDDQELHHVLVLIGLGVGVRALDLAVKLGRALTQYERVSALRVFFEERLPLLRLGDVLLP